jgi:hypothetical protein
MSFVWFGTGLPVHTLYKQLCAVGPVRLAKRWAVHSTAALVAAMRVCVARHGQPATMCAWA